MVEKENFNTPSSNCSSIGNETEKKTYLKRSSDVKYIITIKIKTIVKKRYWLMKQFT